MGERSKLAEREFGSLKAVTGLPKPTPFLKWAGGKGQLLGQMKEYFPDDFGTYYEPFLGGGAVFFSLEPRKAVLTDLNPELIKVFQIVRDVPNALMAALDRHFPHRKNSNYFYEVRSWNPAELSTVERAARTVFLNKTCYNGLYRVNAQGQFNVPFGKYKNPTLYDRNNLLAASAALTGKIVDEGDYHDICEYPAEGDFVYLDPPYQPLSATASFTGYTKGAFDESNQKELSATFRDLDRKGCKVMLSNSATDFVRSLYEGYRLVKVTATRAINCKPGGRGAIDEFLIMNYG